MKVFFISNYSDLYGANKMLLVTLNGLKKKGVDTEVLLPNKGRICNELSKMNIKYSIIPYYSAFPYVKYMPKYFILPFLWMLNIVVFPFILLRVKKSNPDLIYSNTSAENIGILVSKILKIKHVWHIHEFMNKDYNANFILGRKYKRRYIKLSDRRIFVSNSVRDEVMLNKEDVVNNVVIYNGLVKPGIMQEIKELSITRLGLVGIFDEAKGQIRAVKLLRKYLKNNDEVVLKFYGDKECDYKRKLEKKIIELNLQESVQFCGFISNVEDIYSGIDILLMFSKCEGFGLVTVEAMLRGIPVVGYNGGATPEIISHKETGFLFDDEESLKESLKLLSEGYVYKKISNKAALEARRRFNNEVYIDKIYWNLNECLRNN